MRVWEIACLFKVPGHPEQIRVHPPHGPTVQSIAATKRGKSCTTRMGSDLWHVGMHQKCGHEYLIQRCTVEVMITCSVLIVLETACFYKNICMWSTESCTLKRHVFPFLTRYGWTKLYQTEEQRISASIIDLWTSCILACAISEQQIHMYASYMPYPGNCLGIPNVLLYGITELSLAVSHPQPVEGRHVLGRKLGCLQPRFVSHPRTFGLCQINLKGDPHLSIVDIASFPRAFATNPNEQLASELIGLLVPINHILRPNKKKGCRTFAHKAVSKWGRQPRMMHARNTTCHFHSRLLLIFAKKNKYCKAHTSPISRR